MDPEPTSGEPAIRGRRRAWLGAAALFAVTLTLAVFPPLILVVVPFAFLVFTSPGRRFLPLVAAGLGALAVLGGAARSGMWYVERGWTILLGGCFAALSLRWPNKTFLPRALGAVALALAGVWAVLGVRTSRWTVIDWMVTDRMSAGVGTAMEALQLLRGGSPLPASVVSTVYRATQIQGQIFPAMLALSSVAALGVAWWLYVRLVMESDAGLGPLRDFRFNDQLVWLLVLGIILVELRWGGPLGRAGLNTVCFMGALYALRGACRCRRHRAGLVGVWVGDVGAGHAASASLRVGGGVHDRSRRYLVRRSVTCPRAVTAVRWTPNSQHVFDAKYRRSKP